MTGPLDGIRVVEVAIGVSDLALGHAAGLPGRMLADLGADVTRVVGTAPVELDADVPWGRVWHRGKHVVRTDDRDGVRRLLVDADIAIVHVDEAVEDGRRFDYDDLVDDAPGLVLAQVRGDSWFLLEAATGFCTQLAAHRPGPMLVDVRASASGTAFVVTASILALLRRRFLTGAGGWSNTSLYDGLLATLGCMIGRSERAPAKVESYWREGSFFPNFLYRCADGELLQVWFGGKGMYASLLDVLGDEPSAEGYYAEQMNGRLGERAVEWQAVFATRPRRDWVRDLRAAGVACEPVLAPGEALAETDLAVADGGDVVLGPVVDVTPQRTWDGPDPRPGPRLLEGVRVADFSAFVAGPLAAQVLADLGADVVKVEPPGGEAMRAAAYAVAACQRGKRSVALDITDPAARPAVDALVAGADVVLHNFRVGVAERLGIDADAVAALSPGAVHCHASAFGSRGPRAKDPGNDALMQALTGFEVANGGAGNDPTAATWIPIDMTGGWLAAIGILAGLVARARTGHGQRVETSLLGAGLLLHGGVFLRDRSVVRGPALDADQTGYGTGHRLYRCAGDTWLAVVVPDAAAWEGLRSWVPDLPAAYAPLGDEGAGAVAAVLATEPARSWLFNLRAVGVLAEVVDDVDRDQFRGRILGHTRAVTYQTADWGTFEQIGPLLRCFPGVAGGPSLRLPGIGEHTAEVLAELGLDPAPLLRAGVASQA